jgi:3-oxoacyl-[acyl-carrier protein] reductase
MQLLGEKIAVVTGVSQGIGWAIANVFIEHGARVIGVSRREPPRLDDVSRCSFKLVRGDVSEPRTIARVTEAAMELDGRVDILVNNAAVVSQGRSDDWDYVFKVNLMSAVELSAALLPLMRSANSGRIINIGSVLSLFGDEDGPYVASKHAVLGLTRTQAIQYGRYGITANCVLPGAVDTEMFRSGDPEGAFRRSVEVKCPLGRMADPREIATTVLFLASPLACYVNGDALVVDGGLTAGVW